MTTYKYTKEDVEICRYSGGGLYARYYGAAGHNCPAASVQFWSLWDDDAHTQIYGIYGVCATHHELWRERANQDHWEHLGNKIPPKWYSKLDYIYEEASEKCTCPMATLLRSGCKCGGK
jgi:hypothetical protein